MIKFSVYFTLGCVWGLTIVQLNSEKPIISWPTDIVVTQCAPDPQVENLAAVIDKMRLPIVTRPPTPEPKPDVIASLINEM